MKLSSLALTFLLAIAGFQPAQAAEPEPKSPKERHEWMLKQGARYPDERVQAYVNRIGQELARNSSRPDIDWTFTVVDSESINAFATAGGYIYMNRGLMAYLDSEAELAGVLGHEIGHITANHPGRQKSTAVANSVLAQMAYIFTGSGDLASASQMYGTELARGYGREHELEADSEGATFMHNSGYDPYSLLAVIGVLKDQETYNRERAKSGGKSPQTYHGLFSTHPRNDKRLQQVIQTAADLEQINYAVKQDDDEFRSIIQGLTWGKGATVSERDENRFYHNKLKFSFEHQPDWTVNSGRKAIVAHPNARGGQISLTIKRAGKGLSERAMMEQEFSVSSVAEGAELSQSGLTGYTGVTPATANSGRRRLALINYGKLAYLFEGTVAQDGDFESFDPRFVALIESFRPIHDKEKKAVEGRTIVYIRAGDDTTFAGLARESKIRDAENQLRLINGHYPQGEPRIGEWIKIIK